VERSRLRNIILSGMFLNPERPRCLTVAFGCEL
jgi:hypothetical protein